jgi:MFS family permease
VSLTGTQMQTLAIHWHVYVLTRSPLALGFVGLTRVVPIIVFSLWGGVVADRRDRRRIMFAAQTLMALLSAGLALLTARGHEGVAAIYLVSAALAAASAFDNPARHALIPRLVPPLDLPGALSLNLTMMHAAMIVAAPGSDRRRPRGS